MIVVAYGLILPQAVLDIPVHGCWNVHASLLPRWRGAAPIQRAIEAGDTETGVCLMQMEKGLDTGPVLLAQATPSAHETGGQLHDRLAELGAQVLGDGLGLLRVGIRLPRASAAGGRRRPTRTSSTRPRPGWTGRSRRRAGANKVRAFNPVADRRSPCSPANACASTARWRWTGARRAPGDGAGAGRDGIDIACGSGVLRIRVLQREGGKAITAADYLNARRDLVTPHEHPAGNRPGHRAARVLDAVLHRGRSLKANWRQSARLEDPRDRALVEAI
jgi:methionyl-tRNA formyltransferase